MCHCLVLLGCVLRSPLPSTAEFPSAGRNKYPWLPYGSITFRCYTVTISQCELMRENKSTPVTEWLFCRIISLSHHTVKCIQNRTVHVEVRSLMLMIETESNQMWLLHFHSPTLEHIKITLVTSFGLRLQGYFLQSMHITLPHTEHVCRRPRIRTTKVALERH